MGNKKVSRKDSICNGQSKPWCPNPKRGCIHNHPHDRDRVGCLSFVDICVGKDGKEHKVKCVRTK